MARTETIVPPSDTVSPHRPTSLRALRWAYFARAAVIGLGAGLLGVAFRRALALAEAGRGRLLESLHAQRAWGWAVLPAIALAVGCVVGWCMVRLAPEAAGSGIPHLKGVLLRVRTFSWKRLIPVKFLGGMAGIGVGLSLGREGPTVQLGAAAAAGIAAVLRTPASAVPQLLSAGAGAGLAAAFNAPLAGLLFVIEELHRELSSRTALGALIAVICATVVNQWLAGDTPSFEVHGLGAMPLKALPLAAVVGLLAGVGGAVFNRALLAGQRAVRWQRRVPRWALPGVAAMLAALVAWWLPDAAGAGHAVAERVLGSTFGAGLSVLLVVLVVKFLLTVLSYSSGAPGGIFAPMLLMGALCGAALAGAAAHVWPAAADQAQVLSVLGMAAFFVGSVRAPLTGIALISEMTGGFRLLFPICIAAAAAYLAAEAIKSPPIYEALLKADLEREGLGPAASEPRPVYVAIQSHSPLAGKPIASCGLPRGCLIVSVERGGTSLLPTAETVLLPGDHISVLTPGESPEAPLEIVRLCTGL